YAGDPYLPPAPEDRGKPLERPDPPDRGRRLPPRLREPRHQRSSSMKSTITGTWSDGRSQPRASFTTSIWAAKGAAAGLVQTWSRRRPLSALSQLGER